MKCLLFHALWLRTVKLFCESTGLKAMAAHLYIFISYMGDCQFIFVFASRKHCNGAGHKENLFSFQITCCANECNFRATACMRYEK